MRRNQSEITEFILLGFGELHHLRIFLFIVFLVIYILAMATNILTILLIVTDHQLHTPMYFFLGNLSCLETFYSSTILPRFLASLLTGDITISVQGCITQLYFFAFLIGTECCLLSVMSYDRYLAICKPLHYAGVMNGRLCIQLSVGSWFNSIVFASVFLGMILKIQFCGPNEIDHFYCDSLPLVKLSCSHLSLVKHVTIIVSFIFTFPPFLLTLTSYVYIIATILRIPSTTGRQKAFSTCSSHLIVVCIFYGALIIVYLIPKTEAMRDLNKIFSVLYTVLPPIANPLIYSLKNKDVKEALKKAARKVLEWQFLNQRFKVWQSLTFYK
ncbi:olfactory receptor 6B1-like [Rhineura floridana]|uniref:olfactory receptor 6B1-like n=1 Tax=Rhineura floridana TaxID=261503 RepID=UPI002AC87728|nr:olfactory receptor 6B1-like [Rhineura floridana]